MRRSLRQYRVPRARRRLPLEVTRRRSRPRAHVGERRQLTGRLGREIDERGDPVGIRAPHGRGHVATSVVDRLSRTELLDERRTTNRPAVPSPGPWPSCREHRHGKVADAAGRSDDQPRVSVRRLNASTAGSARCPRAEDIRRSMSVPDGFLATSCSDRTTGCAHAPFRTASRRTWPNTSSPGAKSGTPVPTESTTPAFASADRRKRVLEHLPQEAACDGDVEHVDR